MWQTLRQSLRHEYRTLDRVSVVLAFPLPVFAIIILLGILAGRTPRDLPIAVVDLDHSRLSREITRAIESSAGLAVYDTPEDTENALQLLRAGKVSAVVVMPHLLENKASRLETISSRAWIDGQSLLSHNLVARDLKKVFSSVGARFEMRNLPDPIRVQARALYNPTLDYALFLGWSAVPAILQICFLVLLVHLFGRVLERQQLMVWREMVPTSLAMATLIRVAIWSLPFFVLSMLLCITTAHWLAVDISVTRWFELSLAWSLLLLADVGFAFLALCITGHHASSTSIVGFIGGPAFAFAGASFPIFSMPTLAHIWAWILPTTHHLQIQSSIALMGGTLRGNYLPAINLLLLILFTFPLGAWLLVKRYHGISNRGDE